MPTTFYGLRLITCYESRVTNRSLSVSSVLSVILTLLVINGLTLEASSLRRVDRLQFRLFELGL